MDAGTIEKMLNNEKFYCYLKANKGLINTPMIDFTTNAYRFYLSLIKKHFDSTLTFKEYFLHQGKLEKFCILRHDVDRLPANALEMAKVESQMGIFSTYYFRAKRFVMDKKIMSEIASLGHEVGYHYESLADAKGDMKAALIDFKFNLKKMRRIVPIHTISMHGKPLSSFDSRDMWSNLTYRKKLRREFKIVGEVYLDINYNIFAYITDTGRNWGQTKYNIRDRVNSDVTPNIKNQTDLINYFRGPNHPTIFLTHPERWTDNPIGYGRQLLMDTIVNGVKFFL